jgi:L,D-peptidoglycan transpeptidase YkuD (ErfK/YbiS/YcfS/YnhG family)
MGYASAAPRDTHLSYAAITTATRCVDDSNSPLYNRIVEQRQDMRTDWASAEKMLRRDNLYKWLIVVQYNDSPPQPGQGSCIFIHIWRGQGQGTAGCTAMTEESILDVARWLDPDRSPNLLQLPKHLLAQLPELATIQNALMRATSSR